MHISSCMGKVRLAVALVLAGTTIVLGQQCTAGTAKELGGNWYCSEVKAITYSNFPGTGSYNRVTSMDATTGQCTSERHTYKGSLAPLSEELSLHFRGPTWLKQLAVYYPDTTHSKRSTASPRPRGHHHVHHHLHHPKRNPVPTDDVEKRAVGDTVTATIDGQAVHWINQYAGADASPTASGGHPLSEIASVCPYCLVQTTLSTCIRASTTSSPASISSSSARSPVADSPVNPLPQADTSNDDGGSWSRQAYFNADAGSSDGFTFLNHFGGTPGKPGTADGGPAFGASLSYASSDGKSAADSPQNLHNQLIEDDVEVIVMSDNTCDDGGCGYIRPDGVAYHGFAGDHKLFMMEFSMPATGKSGYNGDMPGIWLLNAQIPLTSQYGANPSCSCWTSGCGEFDLFEVLDSGNTRCKSTLHMAPAGGSSDYFERPVNKTIKAAVLFMGSNESARIQVLDDQQVFDDLLAADLVQSIAKDDRQSMSSVFRLANEH